MHPNVHKSLSTVKCFQTPIDIGTITPMTEEAEEYESSIANSASWRQIIVLLDKAALETVKTKKGDFQLLNCDDHVNIMKRNNKDPSTYRPDILHQVRNAYFLRLIY